MANSNGRENDVDPTKLTPTNQNAKEENCKPKAGTRRYASNAEPAQF